MSWSEIASLVGLIVLLGGAIVGGIFAVIGLFDRSSKMKREQLDAIESRLVNLQKEEISVLTLKLDDALKRMTNMENELRVVKTLPLQQMAVDGKVVSDTLNQVAKLLANQEEIISYFYSTYGPQMGLPERRKVKVSPSPKRRSNDSIAKGE